MSSNLTTPKPSRRQGSITRAEAKKLAAQLQADSSTPKRDATPAKPAKKTLQQKETAKTNKKRKSPSPEPLDGDTDVESEIESPPKRKKASPKSGKKGSTVVKDKPKKSATPVDPTPPPVTVPPAAIPSTLPAQVQRAVQTAMQPYLALLTPLMQFQLVCAKLNGRDSEEAAMHQAEVLSLVEGLKAKSETAVEEPVVKIEDDSSGLDFLSGQFGEETEESFDYGP